MAVSAIRALDQIVDELENPRDLFEDIGSFFEQQIEQRFEREIDPDGRAWEPLAELTVRQKGHDKILVDSGRMRSSAGYFAGGDFVEIGIGADDSFYAQFHETGTEKMPRRAMLIGGTGGIGAMDESGFNNILQSYFGDLVND